jgi:tetratricopeptide (TPR) repeat protein
VPAGDITGQVSGRRTAEVVHSSGLPLPFPAPGWCDDVGKERRRGGVVRGWRSWGRWGAATILAVLGIAATAAKAMGWGWPWLAVTGVVVTAVFALPARVLTTRIERADQQSEQHQDRLRAGVPHAGRRTVGDFSDPTELGVHRALLAQGTGATDRVLPAYIVRDQHDAVVAALQPSAFVLLVGDSGAGKSRLAFEALAATVPGHRLIAPERTAMTAAIEESTTARDTVLWLDDLENYLDNDTGLTTTAITRVLGGAGHRRMIVATLRLQELNRLDEETDNHQLNEDRRKVLARAHQIRVDRLFSDSELERARRDVLDPRIAAALEHTERYGLAEYLAAGPQLLNRWVNGWAPGTHPRGAALVQAATEVRRAGFLGSLPRALLAEIHQHYLDTRAPRLRPEPVEQAWSWACEPWRDTTAMLEPDADDTVTVFDYLVDHVQRSTPPGDLVPEAVVRQALSHAKADDASIIGRRAHEQGRYELARTAMTKVVTVRTATLGGEHPDTLTGRSSLGAVLADQGDLSGAAAEFRAVQGVSQRVLGEQHPDTLTARNNMATVLARQGDLAAAEAEIVAVADARTLTLGPDHPDTLTSRSNLATVRYLSGNLAGAVAEYRAVLDIRRDTLGDEHPETLSLRTSLANVLGDQGQLEPAAVEQQTVLDVRRRMLGDKHPDTLASRNNLATVLARQGDYAAAATEFTAVLDARRQELGAEHPETLRARCNYANVLVAQGQTESAATEYRAVLEVCERTLGANHPFTRDCAENLATIETTRPSQDD